MDANIVVKRTIRCSNKDRVDQATELINQILVCIIALLANMIPFCVSWTQSSRISWHQMSLQSWRQRVRGHFHPFSDNFHLETMELTSINVDLTYMPTINKQCSIVVNSPKGLVDWPTDLKTTSLFLFWIHLWTSLLPCVWLQYETQCAMGSMLIRTCWICLIIVQDLDSSDWETTSDEESEEDQDIKADDTNDEHVITTYHCFQNAGNSSMLSSQIVLSSTFPDKHCTHQLIDFIKTCNVNTLEIYWEVIFAWLFLLYSGVRDSSIASTSRWHASGHHWRAGRKRSESSKVSQNYCVWLLVVQCMVGSLSNGSVLIA